jgi:hypothetical protein
MNHPSQSKKPSISNQQSAFVTHLPEAAAMLLFGTTPLPADPKFTLMDEEHLAGVSIVIEP